MVSLLYACQKKEETVIDYDFYYNDKYYAIDRSKETVLVVGLDTYATEMVDDYRNNQLADFVMLLVIDDYDKTITPIQINRDTMLDINVLGMRNEIVSTTYGQLSLSHSYGDGGLVSLLNVKDAVSKLFFNIHINYSLAYSMDSVAIVNDLLGGVTVYLEDDLSILDEDFVQGTYLKLNGEQALKFVRNRYDLEDATNINRMKRQREYIKEISKLLSEKSSDNAFIKELLNKMSGSMTSSANFEDLNRLLEKIKNFKLNDTLVVDGEAKLGEKYIEYYAYKDSLLEIAANTLFKEVK